MQMDTTPLSYTALEELRGLFVPKIDASTVATFRIEGPDGTLTAVPLYTRLADLYPSLRELGIEVEGVGQVQHPGDFMLQIPNSHIVVIDLHRTASGTLRWRELLRD